MGYVHGEILITTVGLVSTDTCAFFLVLLKAPASSVSMLLIFFIVPNELQTVNFVGLLSGAGGNIGLSNSFCPCLALDIVHLPR